MRISKTKKEIVNLLNKTAVPLDAIYLTNKLKVNKTTIYRDIESLLSENKIEEIQFGDGKKRYELKSNHHHHLVCKSCGKIEDVTVNENELLKNLSKTNFLIENHSLEFFGFCPNCK